MMAEQDFLDALNEGLQRATQIQRTHYHLTLGKLIFALNAKCDEADPWHVEFSDTGGYPCAPQSYRGYYEDLAFEERTDGRLSVKALHGICVATLGTTITGYKGGDYTVDSDTVLWRSAWGEASDEAIVGVHADHTRLTLVLEIRRVE